MKMPPTLATRAKGPAVYKQAEMTSLHIFIHIYIYIYIYMIRMHKNTSTVEHTQTHTTTQPTPPTPPTTQCKAHTILHMHAQNSVEHKMHVSWLKKGKSTHTHKDTNVTQMHGLILVGGGRMSLSR